jgi:molecular chaperone DnaK (HSP70)
MTAPRYVVGIDLGTTNTLCAIWQEDKPAPEIVPIDQPYFSADAAGFRRHELLPSAVAVTPHGVLVGHFARELARQGHVDVVTSIKRHMGSRESRRLGGQDYTPERISACILRAVRRQIETIATTPPAQVIITVPACFGTEQRRATLRAAQIAGFDPTTTRLFDEPAAALFYQIHLDREALQGSRPKRLMMIDIGGGTLDVSLLRIQRLGAKLHVDIQGRSRFNELAGDDFDLRIAGLLLVRYEEARGSLHSQSFEASRQVFYELLREAEKAKISLSQAGARASREQFARIVCPIEVRLTPDGEPWQSELSLEDLGVALKEFFPYYGEDETRRDEYSFFRPIQQCLASVSHITEQKCTPADIDAVFLAGGSSLLPMVSRAVWRIMEREPVVVDKPMLAVALGAGWYAGMMEGYGGEEIVPQERLFEGLYLQTQGGQFRQLLSPRETVPLKRLPIRDAWQTSSPDRRIEFALFSGMGDDLSSLLPLARRRVDFQELLPQGQPIHLEVSVTRNRQVELDCSTDFGGKTLKGRVEVSTALGWQAENQVDAELPEVNRPQRENVT